MGGSHGDGSRAVRAVAGGHPTGPKIFIDNIGDLYTEGAFYSIYTAAAMYVGNGGPLGLASFGLDTSRVVPTANKTQPRAWGALACCYLGAPR